MIIFSQCSKPISQSKIIPPIPELTPFAKIYTFCADEKSQIITSNKTIITIPANALTDSLGQAVSGEIDLHFLELLDIAEIFASGIPMEAQSNMMSSGGMFDIQAYQNDKKLHLQKDKAIEIAMPTKQDSIAYPIWQYDDEIDEWLAQSDSLLYAPNPEKEELLNLKKELNPPLQIPLSNKNFCFNYATIIDVHYGNYNSKATTDVLKKASSYGFTFSQINNSTLITYYGQTIPANMFLWRNLSSQKIPNNGKNYSSILTPVEKNSNRFKLLVYINDDTLFNGNIQTTMPLAHLYRYSPENWVGNYDKYLKEMEDVEAQIEATANFIKQTQINRFGLYNYDYLIKNNEAKSILASFMLPNGSKAGEVFYVVKSKKIAVKYPETDWNKFRILNVEDDIILSIGKNRKAYIYYPSQDDFFQEESVQTFQLKQSPVIINSLDDIHLLFQDNLQTKAF